MQLYFMQPAPTAFGFIPALGQHPGGSGGGTSVHLSEIEDAGEQSYQSAEARFGFRYPATAK